MFFSTMTSNWTDSSPLTFDDNIWLSRIGLTTDDIIYVSAPTQFLGNQLYSYGQRLEFDIRVLGGEDLDLTGTKPLILQGNGKTYLTLNFFYFFVLSSLFTPLIMVVYRHQL